MHQTVFRSAPGVLAGDCDAPPPYGMLPSRSLIRMAASRYMSAMCW